MRKYIYSLLFIVVMAGAYALPAAACGGTLHMYISETAFKYVRTPQLIEFLERNRNTVLWSSWYPDSGYTGGNTYGEYSHWHGFLDGYADYIKNDIGPDHKDYEMLVANFMGASSHSMEDQVFDHLFLIKTDEVDGTGQAELDRGLDMVCMYECKRYDFNLSDDVMAHPDKYTPIRHLGRIYEKLGTDFPNITKQIFKGQRMLALAIHGEKLISGVERFDVMKISPWGTANYMTAPGGIEHEAKIVAAYWDSLWEKLHGGPGDFIIATFPENGGSTLSVDHTTVDSNISIFMDRVYARETITPETFIVEAADGSRVPGSFNWNYGSDTFRFIPAADLAPGAQYTVTLTTGIKDTYGNLLPENYTFAFNTP